MPPSALNLAVTRRTVAALLDIPRLDTEDGVDQALLILVDTYLGDFVDTIFQDSIAPAQKGRADQDSHQVRSDFKQMCHAAPIG